MSAFNHQASSIKKKPALFSPFELLVCFHYSEYFPAEFCVQCHCFWCGFSLRAFGGILWVGLFLFWSYLLAALWF